MRQWELFEEAKQKSERVIPAMFIEDCAYCEEQAVERLEKGFYNHFYSTQPPAEESDVSRDELPSDIQSAIGAHDAVTESLLEDGEASETHVQELWERVAEGGAVTAQLPLLRHIEREDCYIHADPLRVGIYNGTPLFVLKRRKTDKYVHRAYKNERAYLWVCGWILHAECFYDEENPLPLGLIKHAGPEKISPEMVRTAQEYICKRLMPSSLLKDSAEFNGHKPGPNDIHDQLKYYQFKYNKDIYAGEFSDWRKLYFGKRSPEGCGECRTCQRRV